MTEREKAILLAPFVFLGAAAYLAWAHFEETPQLANPGTWSQAEATVRFTRRDCQRTQRLGGGCEIQVYFSDLEGPIGCPAKLASCDGIHGRLHRGTVVNLKYRCEPGIFEFGRGCRLGALSIGTGPELLSLEQTAQYQTASRQWQLPAAVACLVIGIGSLGYVGRRA